MGEVDPPLAIGNPSELKANCPDLLADAIKRVNEGQLAAIGEVLHPNPAYSAEGLNIASVCFYVDMDEAHGGYQPLELFGVHPVGQRRTCSIYAGRRMTTADRLLYQSWTTP